MRKIHNKIIGLATLFLITSFIATAHADYIISSTDECLESRNGRCILRCLETYNGDCSNIECHLPNGQAHRLDFSFTYSCGIGGGGSFHDYSAQEFREMCEEANDDAEVATNQCQDQVDSLNGELTDLGREFWDLSGRLSGCRLTNRRFSNKLDRICEETATLRCASSQNQELGCKIREIAGCDTHPSFASSNSNLRQTTSLGSITAPGRNSKIRQRH